MLLFGARMAMLQLLLHEALLLLLPVQFVFSALSAAELLPKEALPALEVAARVAHEPRRAPEHRHQTLPAGERGQRGRRRGHRRQLLRVRRPDRGRHGGGRVTPVGGKHVVSEVVSLASGGMNIVLAEPGGGGGRGGGRDSHESIGVEERRSHAARKVDNLYSKVAEVHRPFMLKEKVILAAHFESVATTSRSTISPAV